MYNLFMFKPIRIFIISLFSFIISTASVFATTHLDYNYDATGKLTDYTIDASKNGGKVKVKYGYDDFANTTSKQFVRFGSSIVSNSFKYNLQNKLTNLTVVKKGINGSANQVTSSSYDYSGLQIKQQIVTLVTNTTTKLKLFDADNVRIYQGLFTDVEFIPGEYVE